jgi:hypothetical protein
MYTLTPVVWRRVFTHLVSCLVMLGYVHSDVCCLLIGMHPIVCCMTVFGYVFTVVCSVVVFGYVHTDVCCLVVFGYVLTDVLSGDGWLCAC